LFAQRLALSHELNELAVEIVHSLAEILQRHGVARHGRGPPEVPTPFYRGAAGGASGQRGSANRSRGSTGGRRLPDADAETPSGWVLRQRLHPQLAGSGIPQKGTPVGRMSGPLRLCPQERCQVCWRDAVLTDLVSQPDEALQCLLVPRTWWVVAIGLRHDGSEELAERVVAQRLKPDAR